MFKAKSLVPLLFIFGSLPLLADAPWPGAGTNLDPYQLETAADLRTLADDLEYWDATFLLSGDVTWDAPGFNGIGKVDQPFEGTFRGNGRKITNLRINAQGVSAVGFFGALSGEVRGLTLVNPAVTSTNCSEVGPLVGVVREGGLVMNCHVEGGSATEVGTRSTATMIAGLAGAIDSGARVSQSTSSCTVSGTRAVGGLVGHIDQHGILENCRATGSATGTVHYTGGLVGLNSGQINFCSASGEVSGRSSTGGLVGLNYGRVVQCAAHATVSGGERTGGFVGAQSDTDAYIEDCYSSGDVTGSTWVGSFAGSATESGGLGTGIKNCYGRGAVTGSSEVGGFSGQEAAEGYNSIASFWDVESTGQSDTPGPEKGKTTLEMMNIFTYTNHGWDFTDIWAFIDENPSYPRLAWEGEPLSIFVPLVTEGSRWHYRNTPLDHPRLVQAWRSDIGGTWRDIEEGNAQFGYGDGDEETVLDFGDDPEDKPITWHFRQVFNVQPPAPAYLRIELLKDDAAIVYVNGVEVVRSNLPEGEIADETRAVIRGEGRAETEWVPYEVPAFMVKAEGNVVSVEVHQFAPDDPDMSFDLRLGGLGIGNPDTDGNGIHDAWELEHTGRVNNLTWNDRDDDHLNLLQEFRRGTNPNNDDTDDDGFKDGLEVAHGSDPLDPDSLPRLLGEILKPEDPQANDRFGNVVAVDRGTMVVGRSEFDGAEQRVGAISVFERRTTNGEESWEEVAVLKASDAGINRNFGRSVAIDRGSIVVGARESAYVFEKNGEGEWRETDLLTPGDGDGQNFGTSVAVSGRTVMVGDDRGNAVSVFERDGGAWDLVDTIYCPDGDHDFGVAIAMDGREAVIGAPSGDESLAYIYRRGVFSGEWKRVRTLSEPAFSEFYDSTYAFGNIVSIRNGVAAIAGWPEDPGGSGAPVPAYVFHRHAGGWRNWGVVDALWADDGGIFYANSVVVGDGVVLVATDDSIYTYRRHFFGPDQWVQERQLMSLDVGFGFDGSLDVSGNTIVSTAHGAEGDCVFVAPLNEVRRSPWRIWLEQFFSWWRSAEAAPEALLAQSDPDADGLSNELEFAIGTDPLQASKLPGAYLGTEVVEGEEYFTFTFSLPHPTPEGVLYHVQSSDDLVTWKAIATRDLSTTWSGPAPIWEAVPAAGRVDITVRDVVPMTERKTSYLRLAVSLTE